MSTTSEAPTAACSLLFASPAPVPTGPPRRPRAGPKRYFRNAPLMIVGEGTNEIQRNIITAQ